MTLLTYLQDKVIDLRDEDETPADRARSEPTREVMAAVEADIDSDPKVAAETEEFSDRIGRWMEENPRQAFGLLRKLKPILYVKAKDVVMVTRYDDVREVLAQQDVFGVTYGPKMTDLGQGTNFFLGMQDSPEYERDVSAMRVAAPRMDVWERLVPVIDREAAAIVAGAGGRVDVARELARPVATRTVVAWFGAAAESESDQSDWAHRMFHFLFVDPDNDPGVRAAAMDASDHTRAYLLAAIEARRSDRGTAHDVIDHCLALQEAGVPGMDDAAIANNLQGLIVGAIPTTAKACVHALDELLRRPEELAGAQAAAASDDDATLAAYVFEALRFNPTAPGLVRITLKDYELSKGNRRATMIAAGTKVVALTSSAMFDEADVDEPDEFRIDRPDHHMLQFGYGLHTCFGAHLNREQIPRILKPLLQRTGLRRAAGADGIVQVEPPFPTSFVVEYDAY